MRTLLVLSCILITISGYCQTDFLTLDRQSYNYYLNGDYKNLKQNAQKQLRLGMDNYYLRMRLGMLSYNNKLFDQAYENFQKALTFFKSDTICREYIYYCYLNSGRTADARLYLGNLSDSNKNNHLKSIRDKRVSKVYSGMFYTSTEAVRFVSDPLTYEAIENSLLLYAGLEAFINSKLKLTLTYTNFRKAGNSATFLQNQIYGKISLSTYQGLEFFGFSHIAAYSQGSNTNKFDPVIGAGISKNFWKLRLSASTSFSSLGGSNQLRGELYFTYLPLGNLNLYSTTNGMYQKDRQWGSSYQIGHNIGFKAFNRLWIEAGIMNGNSFLYAQNMGAVLNNSFLIPVFSFYGNAIILLGNHFNITLTPSFNKYSLYSWDLINYTRDNEVKSNSPGISFTIIYKI